MRAKGSMTNSALAAFAGVLSLVNVCSAAPKPIAPPSQSSAHSIVDLRVVTLGDSQGLSRRELSEEIIEFQDRINGATSKVLVDSPVFESFENDDMSVATAGFDSGVGVVIGTKAGAIVGHFKASASGLDVAKSKLPELFRENSHALNGGQGIVYGQTVAGKSGWKSPDLIADFSAVIEDLTGEAPEEQEYLEPEDDWVDQDGVPLDGVDYHNFQSGGFVLENAGGGDKDTRVTFITASILGGDEEEEEEEEGEEDE